MKHQRGINSSYQNMETGKKEYEEASGNTTHPVEVPLGKNSVVAGKWRSDAPLRWANIKLAETT